jgi:predicted ATPase/DNA-binding SARP family transcriptional activator
MLRIHLFGRFRLFVGDEAWPFNAPPKTLPLLAYLLLNRTKRIPRQNLSFILWPDDTEDAARANLRRHLHSLRQALPQPPPNYPWLLSDAKTLAWNPEVDAWLDVDEFERLSDAPENQVRAVELYHGDLLNDLYDDWLIVERERLRERFFHCLTQLIHHHRARRDFPEAITYARRMLSHDPLHENVIRQLIALRYAIGDRAGALKEYERFLERLRVELGVNPMPETVALYETVLRQGPLPEFPISAPEPVSPPPLDLPFTGRTDELQTLKAGWQEARSGRGRLVLMAGESGIGKTRLVSEFALEVEGSGGRLLRGATSPIESTPYQPFLVALRTALPMLAAVNMDPLWLSTVSLVLPELPARHAVTQFSTLPRLDPQGERRRLFEALARCMEALAYPRPMLLILEDLHWAGAGTLALLEYLARRTIQHHLLIVGTYREEETHPAHPLRELRRRLQSENLLTHVSLGPLSREAVDSILAQRLEQKMANDALMKRIHDVSGGNPFFLRELIRDVVRHGDGRVDTSVIEMQTLPASISQAVSDRVARLSTPARTLAEVASVIGTAFDIDLACQVGGWREGQIWNSVDELLDQQIIQETVGGGRFDFAFTHDLLHGAFYQEMPEHLRRRRHRRAGHVLEKLKSGELESLAVVLAQHFARGGEPERAALHYERAARHSLTLYADVEALSALQNALDLTEDLRRQFDLLVLREEIFHRHGDRPAQQQILERLEALADKLDQFDLSAEILRRRIRYHSALGERDHQKKLIADFGEHARKSGQSNLVAESLLAEAAYYSLCGDYEQAGVFANQASDLYQALDDRNGKISAHLLLTDLTIQRWDFKALQDKLDLLTALTAEHPDQGILVKKLHTASGAAFSRQEYETSRSLSEQMLGLCRKIGDREGEADACSRLASVSARLFRVEQAREYYDLAAALYKQMGKRQGLGAVFLNRGMLAVNLGSLDDALRLFEGAAEIFLELNDLRGQTLCALNHSAAAIYRGDYPAAGKSAEHSLELARRLGLGQIEAQSLGNMGEASLRMGDPEGAVRYLKQAISLRRKYDIPPGDSGSDLSALVEAFVAIGNLRRIREAVKELRMLFEKAAQSMPYPQYALWAMALGYQALGDSKTARSHIAVAFDLLQKKADAIPEGPFRTSFFHLFYNRRILETYSKGEISPPVQS